MITTKRAYEDLERDGFIQTFPGKGSYVAQKNMEFIREERLKRAEQQLLGAVDIAKSSGIALEELVELLTLLYKGDS